MGDKKAVEKRNVRGIEGERKRGEFVKKEKEMREKGRESEHLQEENSQTQVHSQCWNF